MKNLESRLIVKAARFIINHYSDKNLSIKTLSDKLDLNRKVLGSKYKERYGCTITETINQLRISKAKRLIKENRFNQNEIRLIVGYSTRTNFYRVFKKIEGITPGEYRNNNLS